MEILMTDIVKFIKDTMFDTLVVGKFLKWVVKYHLINLDIKEIRENGFAKVLTIFVSSARIVN